MKLCWHWWYPSLLSGILRNCATTSSAWWLLFTCPQDPNSLQMRTYNRYRQCPRCCWLTTAEVITGCSSDVSRHEGGDERIIPEFEGNTSKPQGERIIKTGVSSSKPLNESVLVVFWGAKRKSIEGISYCSIQFKPGWPHHQSAVQGLKGLFVMGSALIRLRFNSTYFKRRQTNGLYTMVVVLPKPRFAPNNLSKSVLRFLEVLFRNPRREDPKRNNFKLGEHSLASIHPS